MFLAAAADDETCSGAHVKRRRLARCDAMRCDDRGSERGLGQGPGAAVTLLSRRQEGRRALDSACMSTLRKPGKPSKAECKGSCLNGCCKPCACEPDIVTTAPPKRRLTAPHIQIVPLHNSILRSSPLFFSRNLSNSRRCHPDYCQPASIGIFGTVDGDVLSTPQLHLAIAAQRPRRTRRKRPHDEKKTQPHYCRV